VLAVLVVVVFLVGIVVVLRPQSCTKR